MGIIEAIFAAFGLIETQKIFECRICGDEYSNRRDARAHVVLEHTSDFVKICRARGWDANEKAKSVGVDLNALLSEQ